MKKILVSAITLIGSMFAGAQAQAACGSLSIADMNWSSATFIAHVDQMVLNKGYGCDAELVSGDTMPTGTSMIEKGEPDVAPEFWPNNFAEALKQGVKEKRLRIAGLALSDGGQEGFWVPDYLVKENPALATIEGIKANANLFKHPEDPSKSALIGCPAGWGCQLAVGNLFEAMELEKAGFEIVDPGSGAALAGTIAKAYERQKAWLGYYWAPTPILGKYTMVKVNFGAPVDEEYFRSCLGKEECENPKVSAWPSSPVQTLVTEKFATRDPEVYAYFSKRSFTNKDMNGLLAWMEDNQADGEVAAEYFLKNYENIWMKWVPVNVAEKIKASL